MDAEFFGSLLTANTKGAASTLRRPCRHPKMLKNFNGIQPQPAAVDSKPSPSAKLPEDPVDFSLVQGGPLFQLYRRARLSNDALELLRRRVLAVLLLTWLPLLLLSLIDGYALGGKVK